MAITNAQKQYCVNNLVAMVVEEIEATHQNMSEDDIMSRFTKSKTYGLLCDFQIGLWSEGPTYIIDLYKKMG